MKQKDVALIIVVMAVSAIISVVISGKIFAPPKNRQQQIATIQSISTNFPKLENSKFSAPLGNYINSQSVDPTQLIQIGNSAKPQPFNGQ